MVWWLGTPFNGNANDESGNGNNGTNNGASLTEDRFGNANSAYYFSSAGCGTRIDANVNTSSIQTGLTISVWLKRVGNGCISPRILEFWPGSDGPGMAQWGWAYEYPGEPNRIGLGSLTSTGYSCAEAILEPSLTDWIQIAYTNDGSNGRFYYNGTLVSTLPSEGNPILASNLAIGRMNHPAYDAFNGNMDDLGVWNRALSDAEITNLFNSNSTPCTANSSTVNATITEGATYSFNGQNLTTAGTYTATLQNAAGCDSVVTLNLTILPTPLNCDISSDFNSNYCAEVNLLLNVNIGEVEEFNANSPTIDWTHVYSQERVTNIIKNGSIFYLRTESDVKTSNSVNGPYTSLGFAEQVGQTPGAELLGFDNLGRLNIATGWDCLYRYEDGVWIPNGLCGFGTSGSYFTKLENGRILLSKYGFLRDIYYSDDNGNNWVNATNLDVDWTQITEAENGYLFAVSGVGGVSNKGIIKSADQGSTWQYINDALENVSGATGLVKNSQNELFIVGDRSIYKSINNGQNWSNVASLPQFFDTNPIYGDLLITNSNEWYYSGYISEVKFGLFKSSNMGLTWDQITLPASYFGSLVEINGQIGYLSQEGLWIKSTAPQSSILWSTGQTTPSISVSPTETTTYNVTVTQGNQTCTSEVTITVNQPSTATVNASITEGESYNFNGQNLTTAGTYTATLQNAAGCDSVVTLNLTVEPAVEPLNCEISASNSSTCPNTEVTLSVPSSQLGSQMQTNGLGQEIEGYIYKGTFNGHAYYMANTPGTWTNASQNALNAGGHLATINSEEEQHFIASLTLENLWIGFKRNTVSNQWEWITGELVTYLNWRNGEPNGSGENGERFAHMLTDNCFGPNQWNDLNDIDWNGTCYSNCYGIMELGSINNTSILWSTGQTTPSISVSPSETTTYNVTVTQGNQTCTSEVTITVNQPSAETVNANITEGESYNFNGQNLTTAGTYTATLQNAAGCDSVVTLNLTVNPAPVAGCYAASVVSFNQGDSFDGTSVSAIRSNAELALGMPEPVVTNVVNFVSLGFGGSITLAFEAPIANGEGNDIRIDEATWNNNPCNRYPERADVFASQDGVNFVYLGVACQDASFDLGALSWAQYVRIVDISDLLSFSHDADGFDVNGIECLNGAATSLNDDGLVACSLQEIVSYTPGNRKNGTGVAAARNNLANALGTPQNNNTINFTALGFGGTMVAKFDYVVFNQPGNDLRVTETSFGNPSCNNYPEKARVSVSMDNVNWTELGEICQDGEIDFANVNYAQYIKI